MSKQRVCVVGAGIIGLSSAVRVQENVPGIDITIIADKFSPNTCSDGSGGFWEPFLLPEESLAQSKAIKDIFHCIGTIRKHHCQKHTMDKKEFTRTIQTLYCQNIMDCKWCQDTWDYLMNLVKSPTAAALGVHTVSGYNFTGVNIPKDPPWKDQVLGYRRLSVEEIKLHPDNRDGVFYTTMMVNVKKYLPWLMTQFRMKNGKVINRKINSLEEVMADYDLVVNCTGIGAYDLGDRSVYPVRGQVIRVKAPWVKHFYFDKDPSETRNKLYIFPGKDFVVLGGTSQIGSWSTDVTESDRKRIIDGCSRLIPSLREAEVLEEWTGLRPSRPTIRLEKEDVDCKGRTVTIIHNYGHAGSGITLFWGCAKVAADQVTKSYRLKQQSKL